MKTNLKILTPIILIFIAISAFAKSKKKDCDNAKQYADYAYNYYKKAYRSDNLEDAKYYAKKGMNESSSAESESDDSDCDCDDAENSANDAYSFGRKAYNSNNIEDAQYYLKKAMSSSEEINSNAEDCEDN